MSIKNITAQLIDKIIKELGVRKNQDGIDEIIKERVEFLKDYLGLI